MYISPNQLREGDKDKDMPPAILFTIEVPLLNPFSYSLRNKKVMCSEKNSKKKILKKV